MKYYIIIVKYNNTEDYVWMYSATNEDVQYWEIQSSMNASITEMIIVEEDKIMPVLLKTAKTKCLYHFKEKK